MSQHESSESAPLRFGEPGYAKVDPNFDIVTLERAVLAFWEQKGAFDALREQNADGEVFSFQDGPITANNPMGVHHAWGRSLKDAFQRYHAMNGRRLRYQNGFDCQGLWVEIEVEKEMGVATKREVESQGIDAFVRACKQRVLKFAARQTEQSIRLGYWMDWDDPDQLRKLGESLGRDERVKYVAANGTEVVDDPEAVIARLGNPEWGGSYFTFSSENNYTIWKFLKKCHERGKIYRGHDVMPWSGRSGTAYSQMEVIEGRKLVAHTAVFVRFPLLDRAKENLLVWTTTPWTLTANVAAAVNVDLDYVKLRAKHDGEVYYLASENLNFKRLERQFKEKKDWVDGVAKLKTIAQIFNERGGFEIEGTVKGAELVGERYQGPFDELDAQRKKGGYPHADDELDISAVEAHRVIDGGRDERGNPIVVAGEGTGIVHTAPGCGDIDHVIGKKLGLPMIAPLDPEARYLPAFGPLAGKSATDHATVEWIIDTLREKGVLVSAEQYPHVYPHCWRTGDELVFRMVDEWYIDMDWRDEIMKVVDDIEWIPAYGRERELEWLQNMRDWMISKKRYWGLALPIWRCGDEKCGWFDVIGSREELEERASAGWETFDGHTPHRPYVDAVKIPCEACGGTAHRVEDVGNPWLDAGIVPYSTLLYNHDREAWNELFPADLVLECFPGQFRNWFYSLLAMSTMMEGRAPFKNLLGHALVRDETGREMHKSWGNAIWFDDAAEKAGADTMRWLYARHEPTVNLNFGFEPLRLVRGGFVNTLWNTYAFFANYARLAEWTPGGATPFADLPDFDRWILTELQRTIAVCREGFESYAIQNAAQAIESFVEDLSNWYVRHNRRRFWKTEDNVDSDAAFETLFACLDAVIRLAAPMIPFVTEAMFQNIHRGVVEDAPLSVHMVGYPNADASRVDDDLTAHMRWVQRATSLARSVRVGKGLKGRQPLAKLTVGPADDVEHAAAERFKEMLADDLNVKAIEVLDAGTQSPLEYQVKPNFKALGPKFGKRMKAVAKAVAIQSDNLLQTLRAGADSVELDLEGEAVTLSSDDLLMTAVGGSDDDAIAEDRGTWVSFDTRLTPELIREGLMRDALRALQQLRKDSGLEVDERIVVRWTTESAELFAAVQEFRAQLMHELLADTVVHESPLPDHATKIDLGGGNVLQVLINVV